MSETTPASEYEKIVLDAGQTISRLSDAAGHAEMLCKEALRNIELIRRHQLPADAQRVIADYTCYLLTYASECIVDTWLALPDPRKRNASE